MLEQQVSICIPVYNGLPFVGSAVNSALALKGNVKEVLVIDNCSTDGSYQCIAAMRDPRIRLIQNVHNVGMVANFEAALKSSVGKYILFLPADDIVYPDLVERQLDVFRKHPNVGFVFSAVHGIDGAGTVLASWQPELPEVMNGRDFVRRSLESGINFVHLASCLCRREVCLEAAPLYKGMFFDWAMWLACAMHADVGYIDAPLAAYRYHDRNVTLMAGSPSRHCEELVGAISWFRATDCELDEARQRGISRLVRDYAGSVVVSYMGGSTRKWAEENLGRLHQVPTSLVAGAMVYLCMFACKCPRRALRKCREAFHAAKRWSHHAL